MARVSALRRVRAEAFITSAALVAVGLALVLLASGPIFADAVSTGALRRSLVDAPSRDSSVVIDGRLWLDEVEEADDVVVAEVESAMADIDPLERATPGEACAAQDVAGSEGFVNEALVVENRSKGDDD